jgi:hypothetical protein
VVFPVPPTYEAGWAPESIWTCNLRNKEEEEEEEEEKYFDTVIFSNASNHISNIS